MKRQLVCIVSIQIDRTWHSAMFE